MAKSKRPAVPTVSYPNMAGRGFSSEQELMEREMTAGKAIDELVGGPLESTSTISLYVEQQRRAHGLALGIIDKHELTLSLGQWQIVQRMMEDAIMAGVQLAQDS